MRRYVLSPSARRDLIGIAEYVGEAAGPDSAAQIVARIRDRCQLLAQTPGEIGTQRDEVLEGLRSFPTRPYVLFFRYTDTAVEVVRVLHARQDVEGAFGGEE